MDGLLAEHKITTHTLKTNSIFGSYDRGQHLPQGDAGRLQIWNPMNYCYLYTSNPKKEPFSETCLTFCGLQGENQPF